MKEKYDTNRWKDISCLWTGEINTVKMTTLPKDLHIQWNPYQNTKDIIHRTVTGGKGAGQNFWKNNITQGHDVND